MGSLQLDLPSWEVSDNFKMMKVFAISCLVALARAAPAADAEADPQLAAAAAPVAPVAYHAAPNCETVIEILETQTCTPRTEDVCTTQVVMTEEIEYAKKCIEVTDVICDGPAVAPVSYLAKREADAEADPQFYAPYAHAAVAPLAAHAVAHSVTATVRHACREVTTEHCVDNPQVKPVDVEVEHCHTVTKVDCVPVKNEIPTHKCEPVETTHVSHAAYAAPYYG